MSGIVIGAVVGVIAAGLAASVRGMRRSRAIQMLIRRIQQSDHPLLCAYSGGLKFQVIEIGAHWASKWHPYETI